MSTIRNDERIADTALETQTRKNRGGQGYRRLILRQLITLSILLPLLVLLSLIQARDRTADAGGVDSYIDPSMAYEKIELYSASSDEPLSLSRAGQNWLLQSAHGPALARTERVVDFVESLLSSAFTRRVSSRDEDLADFGLTGDTTRALFYDARGRELAAVYLGNLSPERGEQYVKIDQVPGFFAVESGLDFYFSQTETYWTELRLWQPKPDGSVYRANSLSIRSASGPMRQWYRDSAGAWVDADDSSPEVPQGLDSAVLSFMRMEGESVNAVDSLPAAAESLFSAAVETESGHLLRLEIYEVQEEDSSLSYFAGQTGDLAFLGPDGESRLYLIPEWRLESLLALVQEF